MRSREDGNVAHLHDMCACGHIDSDHVVRYYETGDRSPRCTRRGCTCRHFTASKT